MKSYLSSSVRTVRQAFRAALRWLAGLRFDRRDLLLVLALGCLTAGLWLVSAAVALTVLGGQLLAGWAFPVVLALRRG